MGFRRRSVGISLGSVIVKIRAIFKILKRFNKHQQAMRDILSDVVATVLRADSRFVVAFATRARIG